MARFSIIIIIVLIAAAVLNAVPRAMNYQGKLTDPAGVGINADLDMTFRIYNVASGGVALWSEIHNGVNQVEVVKGLFDVELGSITPINLDFSADYWLDLVVDGEVLSPRIKLSTVPYAFRAAIADSVAGGGGGSDADWTVSGVNIYSGVTGNVGIGETSPTHKLHIAGTDDALRIEGSGGLGQYGTLNFGDGDYVHISEINDDELEIKAVDLRILINSDDGDADDVLISDGTNAYWGPATGSADADWNIGSFVVYNLTDNVGIGLSTPSHKLHIYGDNDALQLDGTGGANEGAIINFGDLDIVHISEPFDDELELKSQDLRLLISGDDGTSGEILMSDGRNAYWSAALDADWTVSGVNMYSGVTGNVGIGEISPTHKLHVAGNDDALCIQGTGGLGQYGTINFGDLDIVHISEITDDELELKAEDLRLLISGDDGTSGEILMSDGRNAYWSAALDADWTVSGVNMYSGVTGNVGIGEISPTHKLHVAGNDDALCIQGTGTLTEYGTINFGDLDIVHISEITDDELEIKSQDLRLLIAGDDGTSGEVLMSDGRNAYWGTAAGGGTPAGGDGAVQYNNGGAFGGDASELYWDDTNDRLGLGTTVTTSGKLSIIHSDYTTGIWISNPGHGIQVSGMGVGYDALRALGQRYGVYATGNTNGVWGQMDANNYGFLGGTVASNNAGMGANGEWVSGFFGDFTKSDCGQRGIYSIGTIYGLFARDTCGTVATSQNYAYLGYREGSSPFTQYGILARGNDYAGYFIGTTYFDVGANDWQTDYLAGEPTLHPIDADWGYIGTSSLNWWYMYAHQYYGESTSIILFDTYDDLALLHAIEGDTLWDPVLGHHVMQIRPETFPKCITNYEENSEKLFISAQRTDGLLIGAVRQLDNEAKTRDERLAQRTDILATACGADFDNDYAEIKIFEFGTAQIVSGICHVWFPNGFTSKLDGATPVVTLTANAPCADLWIAEKNSLGFTVKSNNLDVSIGFDWSAFARVEIETGGDVGDVFQTEKPNIRGNYPLHLPDEK